MSTEKSRELTPDEQFRLKQLRDLIKAGLATEAQKAEYLKQKMSSDTW